MRQEHAIREGSVEYITKSWSGGGRERAGYIALVRIPGDDTYEVGLAPLRKKLGLSRLTPEQAKVLSEHKPDSVTFTGTCHQTSYGPLNNLQLTLAAADNWAEKVGGLL